MSESLIVGFAWLAGIALGAMFFGGLWLTVRRAILAGQPALWLLGSLVVRTGLALAGFLLISAGHWPRLVACVVGFVLARLVVMRWTRTTADGAGHAA